MSIIPVYAADNQTLIRFNASIGQEVNKTYVLLLQ